MKKRKVFKEAESLYFNGVKEGYTLAWSLMCTLVAVFTLAMSYFIWASLAGLCAIACFVSFLQTYKRSARKIGKLIDKLWPVQDS